MGSIQRLFKLARYTMRWMHAAGILYCNASSVWKRTRVMRSVSILCFTEARELQESGLKEKMLAYAGLLP